MEILRCPTPAILHDLCKRLDRSRVWLRASAMASVMPLCRPPGLPEFAVTYRTVSDQGFSGSRTGLHSQNRRFGGFQALQLYTR